MTAPTPETPREAGVILSHTYDKATGRIEYHQSAAPTAEGLRAGKCPSCGGSGRTLTGKCTMCQPAAAVRQGVCACQHHGFHVESCPRADLSRPLSPARLLFAALPVAPALPEYGVITTIGGGALLVDRQDEDAPVARFTSPAEGERFRAWLAALASEVARLTEERDEVETTIRNAAYLLARRLEGASVEDSYVEGYRVLFEHLYPDAARRSPLPDGAETDTTTPEV